MTTPLAVIDAADPLATAYRRAWAAIVAVEAAIVADPRPWRRVSARRSFLAGTAQDMAALDADTSRWFAGRFPELYAAGATDTAAVLGMDFTWSDGHLSRVVALAAVSIAALRRATRGTVRTSRTLMGALSRHPDLLAGPSDDLTRLVTDGRVHSVRYADRSRHGLAEYAPMVLDTATTTVYTAGTLGMGAEAGVSTYVVSDGFRCGWATHDDPDGADGSLRSPLEVAEFPLSHPRCRRSCKPWPWTSAPARDVLGAPA